MGRWGLEGMASFEQAGVARKEGARLGGAEAMATAYLSRMKSIRNLIYKCNDHDYIS